MRNPACHRSQQVARLGKALVPSLFWNFILQLSFLPYSLGLER